MNRYQMKRQAKLSSISQSVVDDVGNIIANVYKGVSGKEAVMRLTEVISAQRNDAYSEGYSSGYDEAVMDAAERD